MNKSPRQRLRGYTLVELMFATGLSAVIMAGVMSTYLYLLRSSTTLSNYNDMEQQSRKGLEVFAEDVRQASAITWNSAVSITIVVNAATASYSYDSTTRALTRVHSVEGTRILITGITPDSFLLRAFKIDGTELPLVSSTDLVTATNDTKQVQISLEAYRSRSTLANTTNKVLSARYILRNKPVSA